MAEVVRDDVIDDDWELVAVLVCVVDVVTLVVALDVTEVV